MIEHLISIRTFTQHFIDTGELTLPFKRIVERHELETELVAPLAGRLATKFGLNLYAEYFPALCNDVRSICVAKKQVQLFNTSLNSCAFRAKLEDVFGVLERNSLCEELSLIITRAAVELAGAEGKIFLEEGKTLTIEALDGYIFNLEPAFEIVSWKRKNVSCVMLDGFIESVGEIHNILQACNEKKCSLLVFCRGAVGDVLSTLRTNYVNGTLDVLMYVVKFDVLTANTLVDLSVVCGGDVVSSLKGDLISAVKFDSLPTVEKVEASQSNVVLFQDSAMSRVNSHRNKILETIRNQKHIEAAEAISKRLRCVAPVSVVVRVPTHENVVRVEIDQLLRSYAVIKQHGLINVNDVFGVLDDKQFKKALAQTFEKCEIVSANVAVAVVNYGFKLFQLLASSGLSL